MSLINTALWYYLVTKHLGFRHENNSTPGVLIKVIWCVCVSVCVRACMHVQCTYICTYNICRVIARVHIILPYTMKVSRHKSFAARCTCRPTRKNFHILSLKSIFEQHHLKFSYKRFHGHSKNHENCAKLFCLKTFMVS